MKHLLFKTTNYLSLFLGASLLFISIWSIVQLVDINDQSIHLDYQEVETEITKTKQKNEAKKTNTKDAKIEAFITQYDFGDNNYEIIANYVSLLTEEQQEEFWKEIHPIMQAQQKQVAQNPKSAPDKFDVYNTATSQFTEKIKEQQSNPMMSQLEKVGYGILTIMTLLMFMLFMTIPALIQIERNTRTQIT